MVEVVVRKFRKKPHNISIHIQECLIFSSFPWVGKTSRQSAFRIWLPTGSVARICLPPETNCIAESRRNKSCAERFWIFQLPTTTPEWMGEKIFFLANIRTVYFFPSETLGPTKEIGDAFWGRHFRRFLIWGSDGGPLTSNCFGDLLWG